MERLEPKRIHGRTYYSYSKWEWHHGKCRRVWQKYLGKLEDIVRAVAEGGPCPRYAEVFQWGLSEALWRECCRANVCDLINRHVRKRDQGLTTGEYLAIATLGAAAGAQAVRAPGKDAKHLLVVPALASSDKTLGYQAAVELRSRLQDDADPKQLWVVPQQNIDETLTFYRLPRQHHKHLKSTSMLERLNEEIKRRTHVVRIFPDGESCLRVVRALAVETHENWLEQHRYLNMDDLREHKKEALRRAA